MRGPRPASRRGHREHEGRARAGPRLGPEAAAVRLGEAARDREPEPGAARRAGSTLERLEDPLEVLPASPGPRSLTRRRPRRRAHRTTLDGVGRRGEAKRVLEHVNQHALELRGVHEHRRHRLVERDGDAGRVRAERVERTSRRARRSARARAAAAPRRPRAARGRAGSRPSARGAATSIRSSRAAPRDRRRRAPRRRLEPLGGGPDRGQRRAQVVADGAQHRGLDGVAAPERVGVGGGVARLRASAASSLTTTAVTR